jgi:hypothetical protein
MPAGRGRIRCVRTASAALSLWTLQVVSPRRALETPTGTGHRAPIWLCDSGASRARCTGGWSNTSILGWRGSTHLDCRSQNVRTDNRCAPVLASSEAGWMRGVGVRATVVAVRRARVDPPRCDRNDRRRRAALGWSSSAGRVPTLRGVPSVERVEDWDSLRREPVSPSTGTGRRCEYLRVLVPQAWVPVLPSLKDRVLVMRTGVRRRRASTSAARGPRGSSSADAGKGIGATGCCGYTLQWRRRTWEVLDVAARLRRGLPMRNTPGLLPAIQRAEQRRGRAEPMWRYASAGSPESR